MTLWLKKADRINNGKLNAANDNALAGASYKGKLLFSMAHFLIDRNEMGFVSGILIFIRTKATRNKAVIAWARTVPNSSPLATVRPTAPNTIRKSPCEPPWIMWFTDNMVYCSCRLLTL